MSAKLKILFALTLVHFTGDFFTSFINPLFPVFIDKLGLTLTQIGIIASMVDLLAFITQPTVGYLADRYQTKLFLFIGLSLTVVFIPLSGIAPNFWVLLLCVAVGSIGSSMFHPSVTGMVPLYAGTNPSFSMSVFNTGGILAFGLGPLFITWYVAYFGLTAMPITMIAGLLVMAFLLRVIPIPQSEGLKRSGFIGALKESLGNSWKIVVLILVVMFLRALVEQSFLTFMSVLFVQKGFSVISAGSIYALFIISGAFSCLLSGHFADRIGFKPVFLFIFLFMTPSLWLLLHLNGNWVYLGTVLSGSFVLASLPLGVTMAQTLAPKGRSMVASLMAGFAYGLGGVIAPPIVGILADTYTITPVLTSIAVIPLLTLPIIMFFPRTRSNG